MAGYNRVRWAGADTEGIDPIVLEAVDRILESLPPDYPKEFDIFMLLALAQVVVMVVQYCGQKDGVALKKILNYEGVFSGWFQRRIRATVRKRVAAQMVKAGRDPKADEELLDSLTDAVIKAAKDSTPEQLDMLIAAVVKSQRAPALRVYREDD
jgi:hypothetical protein